MAGLGLLSAIMRYCVNIYSSKAGETLVKTSRDLLYHHIQHLPWKWHMQNPTGDIIQRCTSDVERIKTFFEEQFVSVFRAVAMIVFALVCMALMNWKLALVPAVMFPIIIVYSLLFHNSIRERYTACDESEGVLSTIAQENLTGVRVVRAFGREEYERQRFEKAERGLYHALGASVPHAFGLLGCRRRDGLHPDDACCADRQHSVRARRNDRGRVRLLRHLQHHEHFSRAPSGPRDLRNEQGGRLRIPYWRNSRRPL